MSEIVGVRFDRPDLNPDTRGSLDVVFVDAPDRFPAMKQWNLVRSAAGVLRGVHAHTRYDELYIPAQGRMFIGLHDVRRDSPSYGHSLGAWLDQDDHYTCVFVPAGVAHGVYFETDGLLLYGLSTAWTGGNEYNCLWSDPALSIDWPCGAPILSAKDADAGSLAAMLDGLAQDRVGTG